MQNFKIAMGNHLRISTYLQPHITTRTAGEILIVQRFGESGEFLFISDTQQSYVVGQEAPDILSENNTIFGVLARDDNNGRATFMLYPHLATRFFEKIHSRASLNKLGEPEVVEIAQRRNLIASTEDLKDETISKILEQQGLFTGPLKDGIPGNYFPAHGYALITDESYGLRLEVSGRDASFQKKGETFWEPDPNELIGIQEGGRAFTWHFDAHQIPWENASRA